MPPPTSKITSCWWYTLAALEQPWRATRHQQRRSRRACGSLESGRAAATLGPASCRGSSPVTIGMPGRCNLPSIPCTSTSTQGFASKRPVLPRALASTRAGRRSRTRIERFQSFHSALQRAAAAANRARRSPSYVHSPMRRLALVGALAALLALVAHARCQPRAPPALPAWLQWPWQREQGPRRTLLASDSQEAFQVRSCTRRAPAACDAWGQRRLAAAAAKHLSLAWRLLGAPVGTPL